MKAPNEIYELVANRASPAERPALIHRTALRPLVLMKAEPLAQIKCVGSHPVCIFIVKSAHDIDVPI
jgi:hypothetical protein